MNSNGDCVSLRKSEMFNDEDEIENFRKTLSQRHLDCMEVVKCKSHQPTLLCIVNSSQSLKKDFSETKYENVVIAFFKWMIQDILKPMNSRRDQKNDYVFVAHNGSAYDSQFIYRNAHSFFGSRNVSVLIHNNRMIELKVQVNTGFRLAMVYFKDSHKFINLPLRALPKSFNFHNELQKGFFPHNLNTKKNMSYCSNDLPSIEHFGVDEMGKEERERFLKWYEEESVRMKEQGLSYDLRKEMIKYCYDDCFVLASAFSRFNESMIKELKDSGVKDIIKHDFTILADFITLPQLIIYWFVGCVMPERTVSVVPNGGYDGGKCGSLKEEIWLAYLDKMNSKSYGDEFAPIMSRYCSGSGQKRVGSFYLDGYRELENGVRECFEFYGCYYHGCHVCFPDRSKVVRCKYCENGYLTVEKAYVDTMDREHMIKHSLNFEEEKDNWIVLWEHEYNDMEDEMKKELGERFVSNVVGKLNPRDAVKGGRTEAFRMHVSVRDPDRQSISYLDVNSLYPYVMSVTEFPVGHPEIRRGDNSCRLLINNLRKCGVPFLEICLVRVLAPKDLMLPYLPHKIDGKLMFFLCRECSLNGVVQRRGCTHDEMERRWIDTYTSIDIDGALKVGYQIQAYYEVWHYPRGGSTFFKDFILNIIRRKIECSGFPLNCTTET